MAHQTRSGRLFRRHDQVSPWGEASEVLLVMTNYLDFSNMLTARRVCQGWRTSFSTHIRQLQLQQPASARAASTLGRKAAAAFGNASIVCLKLLEVQDPAIDLTADDDEQPEFFGLGQAAAAAALVRQFSKGARLQQLHLVTDISQTCTCLPALVKAAPQLVVLDLSCCPHRPDDLLMLAQHAPLLQELLLHCQAFTTLSGRRIRHGFDALGTLTSLTGLHAIRHGRCHNSSTPAAAMTALSCLTRLKELRCETGQPGHESFKLQQKELAQSECWGIVLRSLTQLTRLELVEAAAGDQLLCSIGHSAPQLQRLVFDTEHWASGTSQEGADAIAHVGHIELHCLKMFECFRNEQLLQLPGIKQVGSPWKRWTRLSLPGGALVLAQIELE